MNFIGVVLFSFLRGSTRWFVEHMHRYLRVEYTQYTMKVQTNDSPQVFNLFVLFFVFRSTFFQVKCYYSIFILSSFSRLKKGHVTPPRCPVWKMCFNHLDARKSVQSFQDPADRDMFRYVEEKASLQVDRVGEGRCWRWYIGTYCSGGGGVMLKERVDG